MPLWNLDLHITDHAGWPHGAGSSAAAAIVAQSGDTLAARYTAAQATAEAFELALQAKTLLLLFAKLALGTLGGELRG